MPYIIMFLLVVVAAIADVVTGMFKARITTGYDSTIMRKGLYCKAINLVVMAFAIVVEVGLELLGRYYEQERLAALAGGITAGFVFTVIIVMESISIAENFAAANPNSPLALLLGKRLKKVQDALTKKEDGNDK